jgi:glutamate-ammonia-ligase adenylyltransferase
LNRALAARLHELLADGPLAERAGPAAESISERPELAGSLLGLADPVFAGVARTIASSADAARFLALRRPLAKRLAELDGGWAERRIAELEALGESEPGEDLEGLLDELRLLRREEVFLAACADFGGLADFEAVSRLLSALAETVVRRAWRAAARRVAAAVAPSVIALGKLGGCEFTYHSDLDLIFLHAGAADASEGSARVAQRLIAYLSTMTGAGVAYAVDARLRPSGQQGALVTSFDAFERYQCEEAQTWEHLALVRARVIAGPRADAQARLAGARAAALAHGGERWREVAEMRARVERERADESGGRLQLKTGPGGLMDVEFLAQGAFLERAGEVPVPEVPSLPSLLHAAAGPGPRVAELLAAYRWLRRVESRTRWLVGRAVEGFERDDARLAAVAHLTEAGLGAEALWRRTHAARQVVRAAFRDVVEARTIRALAAATPAAGPAGAAREEVA